MENKDIELFRSEGYELRRRALMKARKLRGDARQYMPDSFEYHVKMQEAAVCRDITRDIKELSPRIEKILFERCFEEERIFVII